MFEGPFFSVVIPTYNREKILPESLGSVLSQTFEDFEIVLVDNGSTDNTKRLIEEYDHPKIRYYWQEGSGSPANPRNTGISLANTEWICLLDSDDWWYPTKLEKAFEAIQKYPECDVFSHHELMCNLKTGKETTLQHGRIRVDMYQSILLEGNCLSPSATIIRKDFLNQHKIRFREEPELAIVEDYDFWLRIAKNGASFHSIDEVLGKYIVNGENMIGDWNRYIKNLEGLYKNHIFEIQDFEVDKSRLWKSRLSALELEKANHFFNNESYLKMVSHFTKALKADPITSAKKIQKKVRSYLLNFLARETAK